MKLRARSALLSLTVALGILVAGCATTDSPAPRTSGAPAGVPVEKLLVVDCLLPPQVRQLGRSRTYLSARRAARIPAYQCEIRGGEYVVFDRADYRSALAVWLPDAEAGDPQAQTYVGEIYEQGLGTAPDHARAAEWYRRAADQGYSRAMTNLGSLHERGLGVPRDRTRALNLYRQASGLQGQDIVFADALEAVSAERDRLAGALARSEAALSQAQQAPAPDTEALRRELSETRAALARQREQAERDRQELIRLRSQSVAPATASTAEVATLQAEIAERERRLGDLSQQVGYLEERARQAEQSVQVQVRAAQAGRDAVAEEQATLARRLAALEGELAQARREAASWQERFMQHQQAWAVVERPDTGVPQAELDAMRAELAEALVQVDNLQGALRQARFETEAEREAGARLVEELARSRTRLEATRGQVQGLERALAEARTDAARAESLERDLQRAHADLQRAQQEIDGLERSVAEAEAVSGADRQHAERVKRELEKARLSIAKSQRRMVDMERQLQIARSDGASGPELARSRERAEQLARDLELARSELQGAQGRVQAMEEELVEARSRLEDLGRLETVALRSGAEPAPAPGGSGGALLGARLGRYHALIIGNSNYGHFNNLATPHNDARALGDLLRQVYGFQVEVLLDADRERMLRAIEGYRARLTENDNFLLYYAGHGELDRANDEGNWLPVDAERDNIVNWIPNKAITNIINNMSAKHVMVIADSCYSGTLTRSTATAIGGALSEQQQLRLYGEMARKRSRTVLTSGGVAPVLDAGGGGHSIFASALLETLRANRSILEGPYLFGEIFDRMRARTDTLGVRQEPQYAALHFAGDEGVPFLFAASPQSL